MARCTRKLFLFIYMLVSGVDIKPFYIHERSVYKRVIDTPCEIQNDTRARDKNNKSLSDVCFVK